MMTGSSSSSSNPPPPRSRRRHLASTSSSSSPSPARRRRRTAAASALALLLVAVAGSASAPTALASQGDRSPEFQLCLSSCVADNCGKEAIDDGVVYTKRLPLILRATFWSCSDNCKYHCTHRVTNDAFARVKHIKQDAWERARYLPYDGEATAAKPQERTPADRRATADRIAQAELAQLRPVQKEMVQFYGKWVFVRFLGMQEPFSVLFSILNLREHVNAFYKLRREVPDAYPLKLVYILHALISVNAWTWSAVFHSRDKPLTERLDYFSAASVLLSGLFFSVCRLFRLEPDSRHFSTLLRSFAGLFVVHCLYLSIGRFDYGYNVLACLFVAAVHELLWLAFSLRPSIYPSNPLLERYHSNRAAYRASKPQTSSIASASAASGVAGPSSHHQHHALLAPSLLASSSPLPAPAASPAANYKGHSPPASISLSGAASPSSSSHPLPGGPSSSSSGTLTINGGGPPSSSPEARRQLQHILLLLLGAMSFEIFDFPPFVRAIDAHALWHLATVPLVRMWYDWLIRDARECVFSGWFVGDALSAVVRSSASSSSSSSSDRGAANGSAALGVKLGSRMLKPSDGFSADGYAGALHVQARLAELWHSTREWATDALRGQNGSIEFHALTAKLNALAGRAAAGFSGASSSTAVGLGAEGLGADGGVGGGSGSGSGSGSGGSAMLSVGLVKRSEREEKGKDVSRDEVMV
ncbi:hypothetical protein OC844_003553 [Tilletia horrida]|nr:hypothetical protein OC844_003553 [Tilletia horrida]